MKMAQSPVSDSTTTYSKRKRDILKNSNAKKYTYDDDFDSDGTASRRRNQRNKSQVRSRSPSPYSPVTTQKKTTTSQRRQQRSYSLTPSRSPSVDRRDERKTRKVSKNSFSPSNITPESSIKLKNDSKDTLKTKSTPYDTPSKPKSTLMNGKISQGSSESYPAPHQRTVQKKINKLRKNLNAGQPPAAPVNQSAARVISAQRVKNNELQNKIGEFSVELEKLREENKLLKKLHKREEKELKKLETQDVDVTRVMKNFTDEINSLKSNLKQAKNENARLNNVLNDRDDELRVLKKRYNELKDILNDKGLIDSAELNKKLERCERELEDYKEKNQTLERKLAIIEKNHKHEIGVELAHHKETKKKLEKISEETLELKAKLEEKERAIDVMNIYSRPNRDQHATDAPKWKSSTQSLNATHETPREKRKEYDRKLKETLSRKQAATQPPPVSKVDEPRVAKEILKKETVEEIPQNNKQDDANDELQHKLDRLAEQEAELRRKDEAERQRRDKKEREQQEKIRQLALEEEKRRRDEEERRAREKKALEEIERQKRWTSTSTAVDREEQNTRQKKDDLLAKLFSTELNDQETTKLEPKAQLVVKPLSSIFNSEAKIEATKQPLNEITINKSIQQQQPSNGPNSNSNASWLGSPSKRVNNESYKFPRTIENLHEGKPAIALREDTDSSFSNYNNKTTNDKDDLLTKLFGNSSNKPSGQSKTLNSTNPSLLQSKLDNLDDLDFKPSKQSSTQQQKETTKASFLPWDIPDAQTVKPSSNTIRRPKETNTLFTSNNKYNNANGIGFIEDLEELTL